MKESWNGHVPRDRASVWYLGPKFATAACGLVALVIIAVLIAEWIGK